MNNAHPTPPSAAASTHGAAFPSLELCEARQARDGLATLLRAERSAAADFLLALAHFDRNRGWEVLGYASLFAFLNVELGLSKGGAFFRQTAARLVQRFPDLIDPLRDGRLCITTVFELSKVLTEANRTEVVPRFFGCSSQQAREVVAALAPVTNPPVRAVVTLLESPRLVKAVRPREPVSPAALEPQAPQATRPVKMVQSTELSLTQPERVVASLDDVEPLTADLRRLHITVSRQFLQELEMAKDGLSHAIPNATTEQVLQAALRLLLEKQAKARGLVKRPRAVPSSQPARASVNLAETGTATSEDPQRPQLPGGNSSVTRPEGRAIRREGGRAAIPAEVKRAVWQRDGGRCCWPLHGGGRCGSTHRLEFDHIVPWADWGGETEANLRLVCAAHNRLAARQAFGERIMARYSGVREAMAAYAEGARATAASG